MTKQAHLMNSSDELVRMTERLGSASDLLAEEQNIRDGKADQGGRGQPGNMGP
ncbi:hypothetical protein [Paenibacillus glucanolyticus]|uniref:hypothetical protein n=1 Tax=Paenibacillus glucanolyticus TaxID=59843 RepID=UPI000AD0C3E5|nr:hypothetical protein [Paenibacillus glucanolyticus]